jgi:hypothetical protein
MTVEYDILKEKEKKVRFNLDIPRSGYILVYKGDKSFFSKQIKNTQKKAGFSREDSEFVHVEMSLGGPYSVYANIPMIRVTDITKTHKGRYIKIVKMKHNSTEDLKEDYEVSGRYKTAIWCSTRCNLPYGIFGVA